MTGPKQLGDTSIRARSPTVREVEADATETTRLLDTSEATPRKDGSWNGDADFEGLSWWQKPSVYWLLGPYAVFTLAFGGIVVPRLNLILDLVCKRYFAEQQMLNPKFTYRPVILGSDNPQCTIPEVQRNVATFMLVMNFIVGGLSAIVAPRLGHLSDRYGRRRLMAVASCGGLMGELITILAAKFPDIVDYRWLLLGAAFDGITGSFTAGSILSQSYTSDCTPPSKRAVSIGYIHACLFTGLALGPLLAGYFVKWTGSLVSMFYVAIGCHLFFIGFVGFVIPESLSKQKQVLARQKWKRDKEEQSQQPWLSSVLASNPLAPLKILWPTGPGTTTRLRINLVALALTDAIIMGSSVAVGSVLLLYSEYMFRWGNFETSRFISFLSMIRVFVLMAIFPIINYFGRTRPAARRLRETGVAPVDKNSGADNLDIWILRFALTSDVLGCLGYTLARTESLFFASGMVTAVGGLGSATVQAAVTKHVPPERVGQVVGAIGFMHALSRVVGPVMFNGLYAMTVGTFPQAIFVLLGSLFGLGLLCTLAVRPHIHWEEHTEYEPVDPTEESFESTAARAIETTEDPVLI